jgi:hypothetical protein
VDISHCCIRYAYPWHTTNSKQLVQAFSNELSHQVYYQLNSMPSALGNHLKQVEHGKYLSIQGILGNTTCECGMKKLPAPKVIYFNTTSTDPGWHFLESARKAAATGTECFTSHQSPLDCYPDQKKGTNRGKSSSKQTASISEKAQQSRETRQADTSRYHVSLTCHYHPKTTYGKGETLQA